MTKTIAGAIGILLIVLVSAGTGFVVRHVLPIAPANSEETSADDEPHPSGVTLSEQARKNLDLKTGRIELGDYWRTLSVPGVVIEKPGESMHGVTTPVEGVVEKIFASPGQVVRSGDPLFQLRLTGERLAEAQSELLKTIRDIELVDRELKRIEPLVKDGAVTQRQKLELEYKRRRFEATQQVASQELLALGLSEKQIAQARETGQLVRTFTVRTPERDHHATSVPEEADRPLPKADRCPAEESAFTIEKLLVQRGGLVAAGQNLCDLAEHTMLFVEGQAFEKEVEVIGKAMTNDWPIKAVFEVGDDEDLVREGLRVLYIDNHVIPDSRTVRLYLPLCNEVFSDRPGANGSVYRTWRFKPGQKCRLFIPVKRWTERIVVPSEAVVVEGPDAYVFQASGDSFERRPVHLEYRDADTAIIANDGSIFPGDIIALNNAYQLNLAYKASVEGDKGAGHGHSHG
ncbi:HlyD family secretion protein [Planctomycetes bacterium Pan216]|uniref:HlyD family secretion protein n=1 Tax=Kolteria novifilia TaxID=2527975 RepID=A0A518B049_9BACT|nr:HlyD family secretion protein [Planctomycetes bacterium Pan216]